MTPLIWHMSSFRWEETASQIISLGLTLIQIVKILYVIESSNFVLPSEPTIPFHFPLLSTYLVIRVGKRPLHELHHPLASRRNVPSVRQRHSRREANLGRNLEVQSKAVPKSFELLFHPSFDHMEILRMFGFAHSGYLVFLHAELVAGVLGRPDGHGAVVLHREDPVQEAGPLRRLSSRSLYANSLRYIF